MVQDLPRQLARTKRFTIGAPDDFAVTADGRLVTYRRDGDLWVYDVGDRAERRVGDADAYRLAASTTGTVLLHEGRPGWAELKTGETVRLPAEDVRDAWPDPSGTRVAYVRDRALRVVGTDGTDDRALLEPAGDAVTYGLAWSYVGRDRGLWWSPDGDRLLVERVDESPVRIFHLADPARPDEPPRRHRFPAAGTSNAVTTLHLVTLDGATRDVAWDRDRFEYVVGVDWSADRPLIAVQSRDQRRVHLLDVDPATGATDLIREVTDPAWVTVARGTPRRTRDGRPVWVDRDHECDTYRLRIGDEVVTPPGLQVREVTAVDGDTVSLLAQDDPTELHAYAYDGELRRLSEGRGVHRGLAVGGTTVLDSHTVAGRTATADGDAVASNAETPLLAPRIEPTGVGDRGLRTVVFRPSWHEPGAGPLPVLLDPYAGPGMQRVMAWRLWSYPLAQWFAEHGFVVVCTDGRGTPGRGPAWERAVHGDIVRPVLDDQVDALHAIAERDGDLDLGRVAIRGWSFGGFLAAAAVLHRPDVFHAAVAGAAVSDQRLYDTYWKERFLGHPGENAEAYRRCSLLPYADQLRRPLLIVQGLADTNVWSLHALRLSAALTAAGKPHRLLPLPGQGHRPADEDVVANLPRLELDFLREALGMG
jgi:dipeptidyl-peptidase 4